jgi:hypothetical protein
VSDPLDDPRATDLLAARPDDVSTLSVNFRTAASESETTAAGLSAARTDGTWTGRAADAFRRAIGRLPHELDRVRAGYSAVADALAAYEPELSRIQNAFVQVIAERNDLETRLGPAQTAALAAHTAFLTTGRARPGDRRSLAAAELAAARADGSIEGYRREIAQLTARAYALLDEFAAVRSACRAAIAAAQRTAPVRPESGQGITVVSPEGQVPTAAAAQFTVSVGTGPAASPPSAQERRRITAMIHQADALLGTPYAYGGGHSGWGAGHGLDCSGFVSAVLRSGGYLRAPVTTEGFGAQAGIAGGPGRYVTIYDRTGCGPNEHVIIDLHGRFYESGGGSASGGAPFVHQFRPSAAYLASFNAVLHPTGL